MRFTESKIEAIDKNLSAKKKANPFINSSIVGIGIKLDNSINGITVFKDDTAVCTLAELNRVIEELTMLKESITEETGLEL